MIEELTRKLNQEYVELREEDISLISTLNRLKELFIKAVIEGRVFIKGRIPPLEEFYEMIPNTEDRNKFMQQTLSNEAVIYGPFDISPEDIATNPYGITREDVETMIRKANEKIADPNYLKPEDLLIHIPPKPERNKTILNKLLDFKRYDILEKYKFPIEVSNEVCERILKEYPFKEYSCPLFFIDYLIKQKRTDILTFKDINEKQQKTPKRFAFAAETQTEDTTFDLLYDLIKQATLKELETNYKYIDITFYSAEEQKKILEEIMKKGYVVEANLYELDKGTLKKYYHNIRSCIKNKIDIDPNIIVKYQATILEDKDLYKEIISSKYALYLSKTHYENIDFSKINFVNEEVDFGKITMESFLELPDEIFYKILNDTKTEKTSGFYFTNVDFNNENIKNKVVTLLNSKIKADKISLPFGFDPKKHRDIVEAIMNNHYLDTIENSYIIGNIIFAHEDIAIKYIRENPYKIKEIINNNLYEVLHMERVLNEILSNEIGVSLLLKRLEHEQENVYTPELYEKVKNFLVSEYGIELSKLDKLESKVGPLIIKYAHNENIRELLKLSDEEIEKVISLFPEVICTVDDAKASYESMIQYAFSVNMPESFNIFPLILHAIDDNDVARLNALKCNIIWLLSEEGFKLESEESLETYLDKLLSKENLQENIGKLHEITNQYIGLARKYYRNNNMYFHKKDEDTDFFDKPKPHFIRYDELISEISNPVNSENKDVLKQFIEDSGDEILVEISKQFNLSEYKNLTIETFIEDLYKHINEGIQGNKEYSLENNLKIIRFIVKKYNERHITKKSFEEQFELPYRLEKPAFRRGLDKKIISEYQEYSLGGKSLEEIFVEGFEEQGINKFVLNSAISVYTTGKMPFDENKLRDEINNYLSGLKLINTRTHEIIENCTIDYLLMHVGEIDDIVIEKTNIFSKMQEYKGIGEIKYEEINRTFSRHSFGSLKDVILAINNNQLNKEYINSIIGKIVREYKSIVKSPEELEEKLTGKTPMQKCYDSLYSGTTYIIDGGKAESIRNYIFSRLKAKGFSEEEIYKIPNQATKDPIMVEFYQIMEHCYEKDLIYYNYVFMASFTQFVGEISAKRHHAVFQSNDMIKIMAELNIKVIAETILSDEETYNLLIEILRRKKVHITPEIISKEMQELDLPVECSPTIIAGFISYFATIKEKVEDIENITFMKIIVQGEIYNGISEVYKQILGPKDAKLIKGNPGYNHAVEKTKNDQRLKESVEQTIKNFQRQRVTIPTFDEEVVVGSRKINVIVGNFTDTCNLTHGERTDACMRIGGAGETLYNFALNNENGFHIRFEDPITHEYISRVTGFRNGNTVFLNQLRDSCSKKYKNEEIIKACEETAKLLIEKSKDSECPIENVIVDSGYAMLSSRKEGTQFGTKNIKEGLPDFYTDIRHEGIVLATTAEEGPLKELDFDKTRVPTYPTQRGKIIESDKIENIQDKIVRVASIKKVLSGTSYDEIGTFEFETGFIYGKASDDWYIYIDDNYEMFYDYIDIDPRAKKELDEEIKKIKEIAQLRMPKKEKTNENVK
ncbi:MAG: hypothetical protein IKG27_00325 [Bacilli bacterium]|nr:hypothetical protein [Bacilli bacterium]